MKSIRIAGASTPLGAVLISVTVSVAAGLLVWLIGFAMARTPEGVLLFTPGAPLGANDPIGQIPETKQTNLVQLQPIVLNHAAFGANIVTVKIDGKVHSFPMQLQPRREILKAVGGDHRTSWWGEEADDHFTMRANLSLSKEDVTGYLAASFFLPPERMFEIRVKGPSTLLIESTIDPEAQPRAPAWQGAGVFVFVGCIFFFATAFNWHRVRSQRSAGSGLARADAIIFAGTLLLTAFIQSCLSPEADWNPEHLDVVRISRLLFAATVGAGVLFWRVRAAYATGVATVWRAAVEGLWATLVVFLCLSTANLVVDFVRWGARQFASWSDFVEYMSEFFVPEPGSMLIGAATGVGFGVAFWAMNRSLTRRESNAVRGTMGVSAAS